MLMFTLPPSGFLTIFVLILLLLLISLIFLLLKKNKNIKATLSTPVHAPCIVHTHIVTVLKQMKWT